MENRATMNMMAKKDRKLILAALCLGLIICVCQGCGRSQPLHRTEATSPGGQEALPFHSDADRSPANDEQRPAVPDDPKLANSLPFRSPSRPRTLPSGTLLTVHLERSLSTGKARAGDVFRAYLAAPLTLDGDTVIPRGAAVTGLVQAAEARSDRSDGSSSGFFQLTLNTITIQGKPIALQTSSLFARGTPHSLSVSSRGSTDESRSNDVRVLKGRPLTFRLTSPVIFDQPNSQANRQDQRTTTE
jgi:hypothetical protein